MERIFDIASNISTPLGLAGFFATAFFLIVRQVIDRKLFPKLPPQLSSELFKLIINRLFQLALVAMVLGFASFVYVRVPAVKDKVTAIRLEELGQVAVMREEEEKKAAAAAMATALAIAEKGRREEEIAKAKAAAEWATRKAQNRDATTNLEWILIDKKAAADFDSKKGDRSDKSLYEAAMYAQRGKNQDGARRSVIAFGEPAVARFLREKGQ